MVHRTGALHHELRITYQYVVGYGIGKFKKQKIRTFKLKSVQFAESWCFKYTFVCEVGGSNRSCVSNTSRGFESIVFITGRFY